MLVWNIIDFNFQNLNLDKIILEVRNTGHLTTLFGFAIYLCPSSKFGRYIVFALFLIIILLLLLLLLSLFLSFFCQKFIRHISQRLLNGNQWNFTGMLSTMSRCADYFRNFQNGRRCHGNGQNAKKLKNTKMIIAGYSPNRNWWNLIGTTSTYSGTR